VKNGATELILVAQDITRYGTDMEDKKSKLVPLIKKLSKIKDLKWIRLLYCYPEQVTDELLSEIENNPKVCKYIDIPLQHVSDSILKRMNRRTSHEQIISLIEKIKSLKEFVAIRTTFMVGFPGETETDHKELVAFVKKYKLTHVGFFSYSREEHTPSFKFENQVPEKIKQKRLVELVKIQKRVNKENNKKMLGTIQDVCYEGIDYEKSLFYGRSMYQAPEIDTITYFTSSDVADIGKHYNIKIKKIKGYDLQGEKVYE